MEFGEPPPEIVVKLYNDIKDKKMLELEWKCPGRRLPLTTTTNSPVSLSANEIIAVNSNNQHLITKQDDQKMTNEAEEFDNEHDNTLTNKKITISSFRSVVGKPSRTTVKKVDMNTIIADLSNKNRQQEEDKKVQKQTTPQTTS